MSGANNAPGDAGTDHDADEASGADSTGAESPEEGAEAEKAAEDAIVDKDD
ncbi:hypothetical protein LQ938_10280 [Microbacterium sp. cx-55]|uniref:hypothetical protein n=1 Tax=unclassified Microbacterium TaxID=2609290 RepID=UPI001CC16E56|nr:MULTISPECIES: hypothetical protein [unclassified Microbacterium]MBZ4485852.1 hypothetical protein [Microbacterium sp. cx-55]MCC4906815.1 hypothetical protein [Microbacterium sp. cx-59]UGB34271.1 hypothetical protein LQ938_10280 [Microbacterium sp. cx-55]